MRDCVGDKLYSNDVSVFNVGSQRDDPFLTKGCSLHWFVEIRYAYGVNGYFARVLNRLDFVIVVTSLVEIGIVEGTDDDSTGVLGVFKVRVGCTFSCSTLHVVVFFFHPLLV